MTQETSSQAVATTEPEYITSRELVARWKGLIGSGTLRNWRTSRINRGPISVRKGKLVLYLLSSVKRFEETYPFKKAKAPEKRARAAVQRGARRV